MHYHRETREVEGTTYAIEHHFDHGTGAPWIEHDGHGEVSEWTTRDKKPSEREVSNVRGKKRFYDIKASLVRAKTESWGIASSAGMTQRQIASAAVEEDFQRMRGWCKNDWHWCGVIVYPLTEDGDELKSKSESLWGIESDAEDYLNHVAGELIEQVRAGMGVSA